MPVKVEGQEYYTNSEVSDELGVSRQTLWRWREKGSALTN
jgi:transposase-like protein